MLEEDFLYGTCCLIFSHTYTHWP